MFRFAAIGVVAVVTAAACASARFDPNERFEHLLKKQPDDPDVLFINHSSRNLVQCSKLADLRPEPIVLASVTVAYLTGMSDEDLPKFERLLGRWRQSDPDNAMPVVLKGMVEISRGKLEEGIDTIVTASRMRILRTYTRETVEETWRLQKKLGLDDILSMGAVFRHTGATAAMAVINASRTLQALSFENQIRGKAAEALRVAEADCRLWTLFDESSQGEMESMLVSEKLPWTYLRLCELQLLTGEEKAAAQSVEISQRSWREHKLLSIVRKRTVLDDPLSRLMKEAGLGLHKGKGNSSEPWDELISLVECFKSDEFWDRYYDLVRKNESTIRPYLESRISDGNRQFHLDLLTAADRKEVAAMNAPADRFWEARKEFYPERLSTEQMSRLIDLMMNSDDSEAAEFEREASFHALIQGADASTLPRLGKLLEDEEGNVHFRTVVIMTAVGDRSARLKAAAAKVVDEYNAGTCWAASRLKISESVPQLIKTLSIETGFRRINQTYGEAITVLFALRDLAGEDFGLNADRWREWGEAEGYLKK